MYLSRNFYFIFLGLVIALSIYQISVNAQVTPTLTNLTSNLSVVRINDSVRFTAYWTGSGIDDSKLLVANNTAFTDCSYTTSTGCLCDSTATKVGPSTCDYIITGNEPRNYFWYGKMCNFIEGCTPVNITYNFSGITSPSFTHRAEYGENVARPPSGMVTGTEGTSSNYTQISSSDNSRWSYSTPDENQHEWLKFNFSLNESVNSVNTLRIATEGYANTGTLYGLYLYIWDSTNWIQADWVIGSTESTLSSIFEGNLSEYIDSNSNLIILAESRDATPFKPPATTHIDFVEAEITTGGNLTVETPPTLTNVTDNASIVGLNEDLLFNAYWTDVAGENAKLLIANNTNFGSCDYYTTSGCLCASTANQNGVSNCTYSPQFTSTYNLLWYARICDEYNDCTPVNVTYNFSGITSPSSTHRAERGFQVVVSPPPSGMVTGTEAITSEYTNITQSDDAYWSYAEADGSSRYEWMKFNFTIDEDENSINSLTLAVEGYSTTGSDGLILFIWNVSDSSWEELDIESTAAERVLTSVFTGNITDYVNSSSVIILAESEDDTGAPSTTHTDYVEINITIGGEASIDPCYSPSDFNVSLTLICENRVINVPEDKNVNILTGGSLTLANSTVLVNLTANGTAGIHVWNGGTMNITDSNSVSSIINSTDDNRFYFIVDSGTTFLMTNSILESAGWNTGVGQRGLEINTTMTQFSGNNLSKNFYGLSIYNDDNIINSSKFDTNVYGIFIFTGDNTTLLQNNITNSLHGIHLREGDNNFFFRNSLTGNNETLFLNTSTGNNFYDNVLTNPGTYDVSVYGTGSNTLLNTSFDKSSIFVDSGSSGTINVKWYLDVSVFNSITGTPLDSSSVKANNISGIQYFSVITNASGMITQQNVTEFVEDVSGRSYWVPYTLITSRKNYLTNSTQVNVTTNMQVTILLVDTIFNIQIYLELNNTNATIYIPGTGEVASGSLGAGTNYTNTTNWYLASFIGNALTGLVTSSANRLFVSNSGSTHTIMIETVTNSPNKNLLVFTKGDWKNIDRRMSLIEAGDFLLQITPTFGYGLGTLYPLKMILSNPNIDIRGNLIMNKGNHRIIFDYNDTTSDNKPAIFITGT